MNMVRHDSKRNHDDPLALEVTQGVCDDLRTVRASQETFAMPGIEPLFDRPRKALMIFALDFRVPGLGVNSQPCIALILPLVPQ